MNLNNTDSMIFKATGLVKGHCITTLQNSVVALTGHLLLEICSE